MINSIDFTKVRPNQTLYLVRYSQKEHPDVIDIKFKGYDKTKQIIEYEYETPKGLKLKRIPIRKANFRIFIDSDEMARTLYDCFEKREIKPSEKYTEIFNQSQNNRPEIWI